MFSWLLWRCRWGRNERFRFQWRWREQARKRFHWGVIRWTTFGIGRRSASILDAEPEKQPAVSRKRPATEPEESRKSKNCRNKARGGAGAALSSYAKVLTKKYSSAAAPSAEPNFMQIMMMNMQQQQQQQQQQQMQYQQAQEQLRIQSNQQFQMMLMMMGNRGQGKNNGNDSNFMYPNSPCTISLVEPSSTSSSSSSRLLDRFDEYSDRNSCKNWCITCLIIN